MITDEPESDIKIPAESYSFETLIDAQARGDYQALSESGREIVRLNITGDLKTGLERILQVLHKL